MTESGTAGRAPRSGSGCGTALGVGLLVMGGLFLGVNLLGTRLALLLLEFLPTAAIWWPLLLVVWGLFKILGRLRTGEARFGILEAILLLLLIVGGTALTLTYRVIEGHGLQFRLLEMSRLVEQHSGQFPRRVFVTEAAVSLPASGPVSVMISLPAGNIVVGATESAATPAEIPDSPEGPPDAAPADRRAGGAVRLFKRVWAADEDQAAARAEAVQLTVGPLDPETREFPIRVEDFGGAEIALELLVTLPAGVGVSAISESGSVRVDGSFQEVEAQTSDGPIGVRGARGAVSLRARDGAVRASGIGGALTIRGRRAPIEVESVTGPVTVESEGAPVWITGAASSVKVRGRSAPVEVSRSTGPVEVETRIAPITLDGIEGSARLHSEFGPILAASVAGPLRIQTGSASVEVLEAHSEVEIAGDGGSFLLEEVGGPVTVSSGRGEVRAAELFGPASFSGLAGSLTVRGFRDTLSVDAEDVRVEVGTDALGGDVTVRTGGANVRLTLPRAGSFTLSAETGGGDFESDFALEQTTTDEESRWSGRMGSGADRVTISTEGGDVILRSGAEPGRPEVP